MRSILYVVVRVDVEHPETVSVDDIAESIGADCDYSVSYKSPYGKIVDTELVDCRTSEDW